MLQGPILHDDSIVKPDPHIVFTGTPLEFLYQNNKAKDIEEKIDSDFALYSSLIYFEIIVAVVGAAGLVLLRISGFQVILVAFSIVLILTSCLFAFIAKTKFNPKKQQIASISFFFSTLISCITIALYIVAVKSANNLQWMIGNQDEQDTLNNNEKEALFVIGIVAIPVQILIGAYLIWNGRLLYRLMEDRNSILLNLSMKRKASIVGSL